MYFKLVFIVGKAYKSGLRGPKIDKKLKISHRSIIWFRRMVRFRDIEKPRLCPDSMTKSENNIVLTLANSRRRTFELIPEADFILLMIII